MRTKEVIEQELAELLEIIDSVAEVQVKVHARGGDWSYAVIDKEQARKLAKSLMETEHGAYYRHEKMLNYVCIGM